MDNVKSTQPQATVEEKELRGSISSGHQVLNHLQALYMRMNDLRGRLLAPPIGTEADSPAAPVNPSELGELEDVLRKIQQVTGDIDVALSDLERI